MIDSLQVGTRVWYKPEGTTCIVVERIAKTGMLCVIRESERSVINGVSIDEVISLGTPFCSADFRTVEYTVDFDALIDDIMEILKTHQQNDELISDRVTSVQIFGFMFQ